MDFKNLGVHFSYLAALHQILDSEPIGESSIHQHTHQMRRSDHHIRGDPSKTRHRHLMEFNISVISSIKIIIFFYKDQLILIRSSGSG